METRWSIIKRIKEYIGIINYEDKFGDKFKILLDNNEFNQASLMLTDEIITNKKIKNDLISHIKSYNYAC
jgi:hypothetical protein